MKTIKQKIWEKLEKEGFCDDDFIYKITFGSPNFNTIENYKRAYFKFKIDKERFKIEDIVEKKHFKRSYFIRLKCDENEFYKVGKDFYDFINL